MSILVWFRRDLRVSDNTALFQAATDSPDGIVGLYVVTPSQWKAHDDAGSKVKFWLENVGALSRQLSGLNIPLRIVVCETFQDSVQRVVDEARQHECRAVYFNREYEVNELERDDAVARACERADIVVRRFHDRVIVPPEEIKTQEGKFYSVFTPYRRAWDKRVAEFSKVLGKPEKQPKLKVESSDVPDQVDGFDFSDFQAGLWPPGENEAQKRLTEFSKRILDYEQDRDVPSVDGTSQLSPYLTAGVISPRQCLAAAMAANDGTINGAAGPTTWISELTWRDFYTQVLVACPRVSRHQPFKLKTRKLDWRTSKVDFEAWCQGKTGYPIVDAGMRQLNQTGWMHNRLRMVTAMFLTKNLLIDWRMGEQYFMQHLVDGDLAANNGGWQWSASTGTDAAPYFRIFNPFSQSKRFDPEGKFIKQMCPELEPVPSSALQDPKKLAASVQELDLDYPQLIVDYKQGRERALEAFKNLD